MSARLLAFDSATEQLSLALTDGERRWAEEMPGGPAASATLLPAIEAMLGRAGMRLRDLDAIAFGRGPGAFTGLRTSCSVAQGLAFGLSLPVLAVDSLAIVAEAARRTLGSPAPAHVGVCMDARMQQIYAARYLWDDRRWQPLTEPALLDAPTLARSWAAAFAAGAPAALAGSACTDDVAAFGLPVTQVIANPPGRAAALLALAEIAWREGAATDAAQALPLYVRDKVALTSRERDAARSEGAAS